MLASLVLLMIWAIPGGGEVGGGGGGLRHGAFIRGERLNTTFVAQGGAY